MTINVKSRKQKDEKPTLAVIDNVKLKDNQIVVQEPKEVQEEIQKETGISLTKNKTFTDMTVKQLENELEKFKNAVSVIMKKMTLDIHYLEITGVEKPIITKQGKSWLAAATGMSLKLIQKDRIIDHKNEFVFYEFEAQVYWKKGQRLWMAEGNANSKEYNQKQKYEGIQKQKSFYDTFNDVSQMAQKRASGQAITQMIAFTGIFETDEKNPRATMNRQKKVYILFYKHFMPYAPKPPKYKTLKNKKRRVLTEKERFNWTKDFLKAKYFSPKLLELNMPSYGNWGKLDIELIEKEIPKWAKELADANKKLENKKVTKKV